MKCDFSKAFRLFAAGAILAAAGAAAAAPDMPEFKLSLKDGAFAPASLQVPEGVKFKLIVSNDGDVPSEFESFRLHREQVVLPHASIVVYLGPLKKGSYDMFDDFHPDTKGTLEAGGR